MMIKFPTNPQHTLVVFRSMSEIWEFKSALLTMHPNPKDLGHPRSSWFDRRMLEYQYQWISELLTPSNGNGYAVQGNSHRGIISSGYIAPDSSRRVCTTPKDILECHLYPIISFKEWGSNDWGWLGNTSRIRIVDAETGQDPPSGAPLLASYEARGMPEFRNARVLLWSEARDTLHPPRYNDL